MEYIPHTLRVPPVMTVKGVNQILFERGLLVPGIIKTKGKRGNLS